MLEKDQKIILTVIWVLLWPFFTCGFLIGFLFSIFSYFDDLVSYGNHNNRYVEISLSDMKKYGCATIFPPYCLYLIWKDE